MTPSRNEVLSTVVQFIETHGRAEKNAIMQKVAGVTTVHEVPNEKLAAVQEAFALASREPSGTEATVTIPEDKKPSGLATLHDALANIGRKALAKRNGIGAR